MTFFIVKAQFEDRQRANLIDRQTIVIARMFRESPSGFTGTLSAENHIAITGTSQAAAKRDLHDLVKVEALTSMGERRYTRYWRNLNDPDSDS
ncbi:MAG: hypothetical protein ACOH2H_12700 [Cypionkella sp.]